MPNHAAPASPKVSPPSGPAPRHAPRSVALALVVLAVALVCTAVRVRRLDELRRQEDRAQLSLQIREHAHLIERDFARALSATSALASEVQHEEGVPRDFDQIARRILPNHPGATALALEHGGAFEQMNPPEGAAMADALARTAAAPHDRESGFTRDPLKPKLAGPFELASGRAAAIGKLRVYRPDGNGRSAIWGHAITLIDVGQIIALNRLASLEEQGVRYELWRLQPDTRRKQVIAASGPGALPDPVSQQLEMPNGHWTLSAAPAAGWADPLGLSLKAAIGLLISLLLAGMTKLLVELRYRRKELESLVARRTAELMDREADLNRAQAIARMGSWVIEVRHESTGPVVRGTWSAETYRIHGFPEGRLPTFDEVLRQTHPDDRAAVARAWAEALASGHYDITHRIAVHGETRWLHSRAEMERAPDGTMQWCLGTTADITEQRRTEDALRASEQNYRNLFETLRDGFAVHDLICDDAGRPVDYRFVSVNPAFERLTGLHAIDVVGQTVTTVIPRLDPSWIERYGRVTITGVPEQFENYDAALGRHFEVVAFRTKPGQFATVFSDVTERHRTAEALRHSEEKFSKLFRHAPVIMILSDLEAGCGSITDANDAFLQTFGFERTEVIGHDTAQLGIATAAERDRVRDLAIREGSVGAVELTLHAKDGRNVRCLYRAEVVVIDGHRRLLSIGLDVTARRESEEAVRLSESKLRSIFRATPVGIGVAVNRVMTEVNDGMCTLTGYTREELLGQSARILYPTQAEFARLGQDELRRAAAEGTSARWIAKNGAIIDVKLGFSRLDAGDPSQGEVFTVLDITAQCAAERHLRLLSGALGATAHATVITRRDGTIEWANRAFTATTGYSLEEAIGRKPGDLLKSGKHDGAFYRAMWETITAGRVWQGEIINRRKNGTLVTEEMTITPMISEAGEITHFIAVKQDVTARTQLEAQLFQAQKMEAIGLLAGGVAHDFNNILAAVLMYLGLLQDEVTLAPNTRASLKELEKEVRRGATLTRQLLAFSRQQAMAPVSLDLAAVVDGLLKMLRRLLGENIRIAFARPKIPQHLDADPGMIEQVVINLCINARDAMPRGGQLSLATDTIEVTPESASAHAEARPGRFVRLTVTDTGTGMDEATLQRIFEPFFTTKEMGRGTGLGLATVHGVVKQHRGWTEVESVVGQGTTFRVYLPESEHPSPVRLDPAEEPPFPPGKGETILIAEDEPGLRLVMGLSLQRNGYKVIEAASGPEALSRWREHRGRIALLVTDMIMPGGMDGKELADHCHATQPELPVIVCTGYSQNVDLTSLAADPRFAVLRKPFDISAMLTAIRQSLDRK